jgi:DNA polymerase-3 subunit delta'
MQPLSCKCGSASIQGHEKVIQHIWGTIPSIMSGSLGTVLFHGPPSVGKRTIAFEAAKVILCAHGAGDSCVCPSCKRFNRGHPDFLAIGQHEKIKVADIDNMLDFAATAPFMSNRKVVVIDNAHDITMEAATRLLKVLEEPPTSIMFFLITSEPQALLPTILSRCIKFEFGPLSREDLTNVLWKKMGFELPQATLIGWFSSESSMDVFSKAGLILRHRELAADFIVDIRARSLLDQLDFIDKIDRSELSIFADLVLLLLTDLLLLRNGIQDIVNKDILGVLSKASSQVNEKALIAIVSLYSQVKRYMYLNINLNSAIKNVLIKTHPYWGIPP